MTTTQDKVQRLHSQLKAMGRALVAFSGGVDSTLLLRMAVDALGDGVTAVTAVSPTLSSTDRADARRIARQMGVRHLLVETDEMADPRFTANPPDRCYHCKRRRYRRLLDLARREGIDHVLDGENADDHRDYRPGIRARRELGVRSPLAEAGLTKAEIRRLSQEAGLETHDKPPSACLASRIPYGRPISAEELERVGAAEEALRALGFTGRLRVRCHDDVARLEMETHEIARAASEPLRERIVRSLRGLGFRFTALDLEGYSTGSLNRGLASTAGRGPESGDGP